MNRFFALLRVVRPHIIIGGIIGYSIGALLGNKNGVIYPWRIFLGYLVMSFIDLSTNYSNDYYDRFYDKKSNWKPYGGGNLLSSEPELAPFLIVVAIGCSFVSLVIASHLIINKGVNHGLLGLSVLGNLMGWGYSHPRIYLKAKGLGEIAIAIGTGFIIPSIGYITVNDTISYEIIKFMIPLIMYGFILSIYFEIPDIETDRQNGIRNLSVRLGVDIVMKICLILSFICTIYYLIRSVTLIDIQRLIMLSLIPTGACLITVVRGVNSRKVVEDNSFLVITALFVYLIGLLLVVISQVF